MASDAENSFALWLAVEGITNYDAEYKFEPERMWRFDFAWPKRKVAVEIEGINYDGTRHQRVGGFLADCEKYEAALATGWVVYRVPAPWIWDGKREIWRPKVMDTLKILLGLA